ncbi:hypothetical protein BH10CHL1_BH10CHL1_23190 [soil metagenome]
MLLAITPHHGFANARVTNQPSTSTTELLYLPLIMQAGNMLATRQASWGAPIAVSPVDGSIWVVNPDAGSVSVIDPDGLAKMAEINIGQEPCSLMFAPDGQAVYVVDRAEGALVVVDANSQMVRARLTVGPEPEAVVLDSTGATAYVTVGSAAEVVVIDTQQMIITAHIPVGSQPYALALSQDQQLYVTHLLARPQPDQAEATDDGRVGLVTVIDTETATVQREITLPPDVHGFPNLLTSITVAGNRAWVPQERAAPALPNGLTTTLFAAVSTLDLANGSEDNAARLSLNDQEIFGSPVNNPIAAVPAPDSKTLYVVLAGSNLLEVIDIADPQQPHLIKFLPTGQNPRGLALSNDGRRGYVMNYLGRSITVFDLEQLTTITELPVTTETLDPTVLRGKILFNNASDPRLSQGSWMSCASCHLDGGADGVTWIFPDGPRQTPPLWNSSQTLPWHWSAALDEPQDVEETIQIIQRGLGLAPGADPPQLGAPNAGRAADLDALAAFLTHGIRTPAAPPSTSDLEPGRKLFRSAGCVTCHNGAQWTISALPDPSQGLDPDGNGMVDSALRNVSTLNLQDLRGATGFDVPSLLNVGLTAPYLHDGSLRTLTALVQSGHPNPLETNKQLTTNEVANLAAFLQAIGPTTPPLQP